jgi:type I restriction enzyme S subunit
MKPQGKLLQQTNTTNAWEQRKLGELCEVKDSARIPNSLWSEGGIPYIRASDLSNDDMEGVLFLSPETFDFYSAQTGNPVNGDVLFNGGGEIGKAHLLAEKSQVYVQGGAVLYARTSNSEKLDGHFLETAFESHGVKRYIEVASAGGTMKHFTLGPAKQLPLDIPCMPEQQAIGSLFSRLDNLITLHQRKCYVNQLSLCLFTKLQADAACVRS